VAALAVVAFHAQFVEHKVAGSTVLLPEALRLGRTGVDLFFVISGFVMITVTRSRFGPGEFPRFIWSRLTRIYPVYWFYFALFAAVFLIHPAWVNASQHHQFSWLHSFFLLPDPHLPLVMVGWSLIHELWFYLVFSLLLCLPRRWLPFELAVWALGIVVVACTVSLADLSPGLRVVAHPYTLEFIAGAFVALVYPRMRVRRLSGAFILIA
jgi:Predicted acyltransferases